MKTLAINLLVLGISLVFALLLAEVTLRLLGKDIIPLGVPSRELGYISRSIETNRFNPESGATINISINSRGFRDPEWTDGEDSYRLMVTGDSFVEAVQVELDDRFTQILESDYQIDGKSIKAYNLSRSGSGPEIHLLYLQKYFEEINPEFVIATIFNGNDFDGMHYQVTPLTGRVNYEVIDNEVVRHSERAGLFEKIKWEVRLQLGRLYIVQLAKRATQRMAAGGNEEETETKEVTAPFYCRTDSKLTQESYLITEHVLQEMKQVAGDKLIVMQVPSRDQVYPTEELSQLENCDLDLPEKVFSKIAQDNDIQLLQLLPLMRAESEELFWGHLNYEGHKFVADEIYKFITAPKSTSSSPENPAFRFSSSLR